ncbi:golvesin C-terminal-like domain-containing protein [Arthrobacter sp. MMS24-S77]
MSILMLALVAPIIQAPSALASEKAVNLRKTDPNPEHSDTLGKRAKKPGQVEAKDRDSRLGKNWSKSSDQAWTTVADENGFHILRASAKDGYTWRPIATLSEPLFSTDKWIGNACATADGQHLAVVYAPRDFANSEQAANLGGFAATVDLTTGTVKRLGQGFNLAYYNPGCGFEDRFVLSRQAKDNSKTRMVTVSAKTGVALADQVVQGHYSSPIPLENGIVAAVAGSLQRIGTNSEPATLVTTEGVGYGLTLVGDELAYVERTGETATAKLTRVSSAMTKPDKVAHGPVAGMRPVRDGGGQLYITGAETTLDAVRTSKGAKVSSAPAGAQPSSHGEIVVSPTTSVSSTRLDGSPGRTEITAKSLVTGASLEFSADTVPESVYFAPEVQGRTLQQAAAPVSSADIAEADRVCAVPRNDLRNQVLQPKPRQIEWTVDQLVQHSLALSRPANWKNLNMPAYDVAGLFPQVPLDGGGDVPPQILLGIIAQESNMWQASRFAMPGATGNPLIGNYYGTTLAAAEDDSWGWDFADSDCGYGLTQVTDGMRLAGREGGLAPAYPYQTQRAVALDYAVNIAAGLRVLQQKWNETRSNGLAVNDGDPEKIENWFLAVWAYNSGFHSDKSQPWGVGWFNNPANPRYPQDRLAFLDNGRAADASHPQDWPYPEKVMGFAAAPPALYENPNDTDPVAGFRPAWWNGDAGSDGTNNTGAINRAGVKPPIDMFCTADIGCYPGTRTQPTAPGLAGEPAGPCQHRNAQQEFDLQCYFHATAVWKQNCAYSCGSGFIRFPEGWDYQADGTSYTPNCSRTGLPAGALVVDDVPNTILPVREGCAKQTNYGGFAFTFGQDIHGQPVAKTDLHQLGAGFNGHFFFAHTRDSVSALGGSLHATGTWTLDRSLQQWTRIFVHLPELAAWTQRAAYTINLGNGQTQTRYVPQRVGTNKWVSLGVFQVSGTPSVSLSNQSSEGDGIDDVAWDAIAFEPLAAKPKDVVVALGDSYSSGEGTGTYYPESDNNGKVPDGLTENRFQNACHRSQDAWSRKASLPGSSSTIGQRADNNDPSLDFHMVSCSGAVTRNLLPVYSAPTPPTNVSGEFGKGQWREVSQLDSGYLDPSTTLVTLSIGGNDVGFGEILTACILFSPHCMQDKPNGESQSRLDKAISYTNGPLVFNTLQVLREIKKKAFNAQIVLMGYPLVLEQVGQEPWCILETSPEELKDLKKVSENLTSKQQMIVQSARSEGINVTFANPVAAFAGKSACVNGSERAINQLSLDLTPGESPMFNLFGYPVGTSAQSFHPNQKGTSLYADVLTQALR